MADLAKLPTSAPLYHVTYGNGLIRYVGSANVDGLGVESLNQAIDDLTDFTTEIFISPELYQNVVFVATDADITVTDYLTEKELFRTRLKHVSVCSWGGKDKSQYMGYMAQQTFGSMAVGQICHIFQCDCSDTAKEVVKTIGQAFLTGGGCDPSDLLIPTQNPRRRSGRRQRSRPSSATFDVDEGVEPTASDSVVEIASPQTQRTARRFLRGQRVLSRRRRSVDQSDTGGSHWNASGDKYVNPQRSYTMVDDGSGSRKGRRETPTSFMQSTDHSEKPMSSNTPETGINANGDTTTDSNENETSDGYITVDAGDPVAVSGGDVDSSRGILPHEPAVDVRGRDKADAATTAEYFVQQTAQNLFRRLLADADHNIIRQRRAATGTRMQSCFSGADVVAWLVRIGDFTSRKFATAFMRTLFNAHAIVAVAASTRDFEDSPSMQYSFGGSAAQQVTDESGKGSSADDLTEHEGGDLADSFHLIKAIAQDSPDKVGAILDAMTTAGEGGATAGEGVADAGAAGCEGARSGLSASFVASCAHHAVKMKATKVTQMLLRRWHCDVNSRARGGETLLHRAANFGDTSMVQLLLDHSANVHATAPKDGGTPLFRASRLRNIGCAILLIEHGARLMVTNTDGVRPVDLLPDLHETQQRLCSSVGASLASGTGGVDAMHMLRRLVGNDENDTVLIKHLQRSDTATHILSLCQDHGSVSQWWCEVVALLFTKGFRRRRSADLGLMDTVLQFIAYPGHLQEQALHLANELVDEDFDCDGGLGSLTSSAAPSRQSSTSKLPEFHETSSPQNSPAVLSSSERATALASAVTLEALRVDGGGTEAGEEAHREDRRWSTGSGGERGRASSSSRRHAPSSPSCYRQQMASANLLPLVRALAYDDPHEALRAARVLGVVSVFPKAQRCLASAATVGYLCTMCSEIETWEEHRELGAPMQEYLMQTLANVVKQVDKHAVWHEVGALARIAAVVRHGTHSVVLQTYAARIFVYLGSTHIGCDVDVLKIAKSDGCGPKNDHVEGVYQKKIVQIDEETEYPQTTTPPATSALGREAKRWPYLKGASLEYFLHVVLDDMSRFDQRLFFLIYRFYGPPVVLFRALTFPLRLLEPVPSSSTRGGTQERGEVTEDHRRIFAALKTWIETRIADFVDNPSLLAELRSLLGTLQARADAYGARAQRLLDTSVSDRSASRAQAPSGVTDFSKAAHQHMYDDARQRIRSGKLPCPKELAVTLAAAELYVEDMVQAQAPSHDARAAATPTLSFNIKGAVRQALPPRMRKDKDAVQLVAAEYERICGLTERDAKHLYLHTCQLVAFDYFSVKLMSSNPQSKRRGVPKLLGIGSEKAVLLNEKTKSIETEIALGTLRKCTLGGTELPLGKGATYLVMHVDETGSGDPTKFHLAGDKDTVKRAYQMIILSLQMMAAEAGGTEGDVTGEAGSLNPQTASKTLAALRGQSQKYVCSCPPSPLVGDLDTRAVTQVQMLGAPVEVARQLTVIEHNMLKHIALEDLVDRIFNNAQPPSCEAFIAHFNLLTRWVATLILDQPEKEARAVLVQQFIQVGVELVALGNFNGVMEIVSALSSVSLRRLRATWQLVDAGLMEQLGELEKIMDFTNNFQNYRVAVAQSKPPSVPYFGVVLKDLTSLHHGNPHRLSLGHINVGKWRSVFELLQHFHRHQCSVYKFIVVREFQSRLQNLRAYDEATIDQKSKQLVEGGRGTSTPRFTLGGTISSFMPQRRQSSASGASGAATSGTKF